MADGIRATPYSSSFAGSANDILGGLLGYLRDPRRTQQLQGLAGLLESTGIPKTVERMAYGEPLTNLQQANVPTLRPETAEALMTLLPLPSGTNRAAMAAGRAGERLAERVVPQVMERGGMPAGLLEGMASQTVSPLTVYHGSPAKFERFDPTKIGSGEGAQAYGYGHYVAESPAVAKGYQEKLSNTGGAKRIFSKFGQLDDAITEAQGKVDYYENLIKQGGENVPLDRANSFLKISKKNLQDLQDMKAGLPENKGAFYEIDLPDEQIARMLDYDNPVDETIRSRVSQAAMEKFGSGSTGTSGELLYKELTREFQNLGSANPAADASEFLRAQGISGIKFLDQNSRSNFTVQNSVKGKPYGEPVAFMTEQQAKDYAAEQAEKGFGAEIIPGTSNFVVFPGNEDLLTILKRNGGLLD